MEINTNLQQISDHKFQTRSGGSKGRSEFFQKFIHFGADRRPLVKLVIVENLENKLHKLEDDLVGADRC